MSFHCLIRTVREIHGQVLKFIYITEVLHTYFLAKNPRSKLWLFGYQQKTRAHNHKKNSKNILLCDRVFLCDSVFKNIQKRKVRTPDVQQMSTRNDIYILIGGYNEMLFSETRDHPCAYVNRKGTINTIHIFNMDDISINPNRE